MARRSSKTNRRRSTGFIVDEPGGRGGLFGVFEDDGTTGYLYIYDEANGAILRHVHVYDRSPAVQVRAQDVHVLWSGDGAKCGVVIWDEMRGIIDLDRERPGRIWLEGKDSPGICNPEWLRDFGP